jgi:nitrate reductase NapAB chaperone NapD
MNIASFVAIPFPGRLPELVRELRALPGCEVLPAIDGSEVAIVVVETSDRAEQDAIVGRFGELPSLQSYALTFASVPQTAAVEEEAV